jgi:GT2 family glycosyltransferase
MTIIESSPSPATPASTRIRPPFRRDVVPALICDVDLAGALPTLRRDRDCAAAYRVAHVLVRAGAQPVAWVTLPFLTATIEPEQLREAIAPLAPAALDAVPAVVTATPVSVVITTCGLTDGLLDTVRSALTNHHPVAEVIVVDNRPAGPAVADALQAAFDDHRVRYVAEARRGLSNARNRGLHDATGEIVAFTDDDVRIDPHWVGAFVAAFAADPAVACVTGCILPSELETEAQVLIEEYGGYSKGFTPHTFDLAEHRVDDPLYPYAAGTFGSGASSAFRRNALVALGGFDPDLGAGVPSRGGEDLDIQLRVVLAGHRLRYEPCAIVWHAHHRSIDALRRQMSGYGIGLTAYIAKHLVTSRSTRRDILRRVPTAVRFHFRRDSSKNANKSGDYPRDLARRELVGMLRGPIAYAHTRFVHRNATKAQP